MASPPAISVVVPTRNRRALLEDSLASVFAQSFEDWELIVVDDASEDDTWEWLERLDDRRVRAIRLPARLQQSGARNTGVRAARAEIVLSLDDDDLLAPRALETHVAALHRRPDAIASVGGYLAFDGRGARAAQRLVRRRRCRSVWPEVLFGWVATAGQTAFRADALASVSWWNESYQRVTDHELWSRLARCGPVVLLPEILLHYRVHPGQWRPENLDELMTRARVEAVSRLAGAERREGEELLRLREVAIRARRHFLRAEAWQALALYWRVVRARPSLLASPLTRPLVLTPMSRCLLGPAGLRLARRVLDRVRALRRRDVDFSVRASSPADDWGHPVATGAAVSPGDPRASAEITDVLPLTAIQRAWMLHVLRFREDGAGIVQSRATLSGDLDLPAFRRAWQAVVDRHPALRTSFHWRDVQRPVQVEHRTARLSLRALDWRGLEPAGVAAALESLARADLGAGFDLARPPLMRLHLARTGDAEHRLLWTTHHLAIDGWSAALVWTEALADYEALVSGAQIERPPPPSFRSFVLWEQRRDTAAAESFWRRRLQGVRPTPLPIDRPTAGAATGVARTAVRSLRLDRSATDRLRRVARDGRLTLNTLLQASWGILLHRWAGEEEVVFGATVSGRPAELPDADSIVGLFLNSVPVRCRIPPEADLSAWLGRLQQDRLAETGHQHVPPDRLQRWSGLPPGRRLFDSLLVFENYPGTRAGERRSGGLRIRDVRGEVTSAYPLAAVALLETELELRLQYDPNRLRQRQAAWLLQGWRDLLGELGGGLERPLGELPVVLPAPPEVNGGRGRTPAPAASAAVEAFEGEDVLAAVSQIWCEALGVESVGRGDNFFDLGGDSLSAAQVLESMERQLGVAAGLQDLVFQSLGQVAASCESRRATSPTVDPAADPERQSVPHRP